MDHAVFKILIIAVSVLTLVSVLTYAFYLKDESEEVWQVGQSKLSVLTEDLDKSDLKQYVNTQVSGTFVTDIVMKYKSKYPALIYTGACPTGFYDTSQIQDITSDTYVNPKKSFNFYLGKNKQGDTEILIFCQVGLTKELMKIPINERVQDHYDCQEANKAVYATQVEEEIALTESLIKLKRDELSRLIELSAEKAMEDNKDNVVMTAEQLNSLASEKEAENDAKIEDVNHIVYDKY